MNAQGAIDLTGYVTEYKRYSLINCVDFEGLEAWVNVYDPHFNLIFKLPCIDQGDYIRIKNRAIQRIDEIEKKNAQEKDTVPLELGKK